MTQQQLDEDVLHEEDFDPEEDMGLLDQYQFYDEEQPRLMPDPRTVAGGMFRDSFHPNG